MGWETWSQAPWCVGRDPEFAAGVCRALVVVWLAGGGGGGPERTERNLATVDDLMKTENFVGRALQEDMRWAGRSQTDLSPGVYPLERDVAKIMGFVGQELLNQPGRYLIGMHNGVEGSGGRGHAVGVIIRDDGNRQFFDPNKGAGAWDAQQSSDYVKKVWDTLGPGVVQYSTDATPCKVMLYKFDPPSAADAAPGPTAADAASV